MSILRACLFLCLTAFIGALAGGFVGAMVALRIPNYVRAILAIPANDPSFEPMELGLGIGFTRGLYVGLAIGTVALIMSTWHRAKRGNEEGPGW